MIVEDTIQALIMFFKMLPYILAAVSSCLVIYLLIKYDSKIIALFLRCKK